MRSFVGAAALLFTGAILSLGSGCGDDTGSGGSGGGGTGGSGGTGGGAQAQAIDAPDDAWTWVDFPESMCMNGEATGIAINPTGNRDKVLIFMQGGNACFNSFSCKVTANPDGYGKAEFDADDALASDAFSRTNPNNPFADYSYVYVPYCTGDVHAGDRSDAMVGGKVRQFHGYGNMTAYLQRLVPTFPDATQVILSGVSAGGFGAAFNYDQVATAFAGKDVVLLDDSAPPMAVEYVPACLQQRFVETWGLENTLCEGCLQPDGVFMEPFMSFIIDKYDTKSLALISSKGDGTISKFWGYGSNDCADIDGLPPPYDPATYEAGLVDLRDRVAAGSSFHLFLVDGDEHVFLDNDPTTVVSDNVTLKDWLIELATHDPAWGNVPTN